MKPRGRHRSVTVAVAGIAVVAALTAAPGPTAAGAEAAKDAGAGGLPRSVTLVTGDKVLVTGSGTLVGIERGEGRESVGFSVRVVEGHTQVVPGDALSLLARGSLDSRLFDVTGLLADGYDDAHRSDLPLIVTHPGHKAVARSAFADTGTAVGRELPTVDGTAIRMAKSDGTAFWDTVTDDGGAKGNARFASAPAVKKIWLDGRRKAALDKSVPQIGAPTAWAAGYDGSGTKIAVLDTGVDEDHPDLKGQETAQANFSDSPDSVDRFGHGTHVASIAAGTGAASGGTYRGVAPAAKILDGKVLDDNGYGYDSTVIAGMQWAVDQGADVVNLSLGGLDTPGTDPEEEAVDRLSATSDTLFVIAAGNEGTFGEGTVGSPGSADAALTVGAVDKSDKLADFSSRGPRVGDGGVKPDVTAPGVAITAAAAPGSYLEQAYSSGVTGYITLDGTSMATPHVAGAAAILAQQHPDWGGERIKDVLTASAKPGAYSSYQQGTGRVDMTRAIRQDVVAEGGPVDFATQQWPHDDDKPVTEQITYRNLGTEPVTLELSTDAFTVDGKHAPAGMFTVSPQQLAVPAGGTASASLTADTSVAAPDGSYGGSIAATSSDDVSVRTAFGVVREAESYNLTLKYLDEHGEPTNDSFTKVVGLDNDVVKDLDTLDGELTVRLPAGSYTLSSVIHPLIADDRAHVLVQPRLDLHTDTTVTVDARDARPVEVTVPDTAAVNTSAMVAVAFGRAAGQRAGSFMYLLPSFTNVKFGQIGPEVPARESFARYMGDWTHLVEGKPATVYNLAWDRTGTSLDGFTDHVDENRLARVDVVAGSPSADKTLQVTATPVLPGTNFPNFGYYDRGPSPRRSTHYVLDNDVPWGFRLWQGVLDDDGIASWDTFLNHPATTYHAGEGHAVRMNVGVSGPTLPSSGTESGEGSPGAERQGDTIRAFLPLFGDGGGSWGLSDYTSAKATLLADGKEITSEFLPVDGATQYSVPSGSSEYSLSLDVARDPSLFPLSTRVTARWTFRSARTAEDRWTSLPLSVVRFSPRLTLSSTAAAGRSFDVPFTVEGAAARKKDTKVAFRVSYDEGRTWKPAKVTGSRLALHHPSHAGTVSLRAELTDRDGNTLIQSIERAYSITE
ncbi:peptidase [Streptomyces nodosus]|nr:peptidase [Streptomyces nodosus]